MKNPYHYEKLWDHLGKREKLDLRSTQCLNFFLQLGLFLSLILLFGNKMLLTSWLSCSLFASIGVLHGFEIPNIVQRTFFTQGKFNQHSTLYIHSTLYVGRFIEHTLRRAGNI